MERYERILDDAQGALDRRDAAHSELEDVLDGDEKRDADRPIPNPPAARHTTRKPDAEDE